ncbi:hypothetical protein B6E66_35570 [Streptomyces maremycinicus]|nr:hypothetical protein B6E66_35570 [Streptomyces sp. B9173]
MVNASLCAPWVHAPRPALPGPASAPVSPPTPAPAPAPAPTSGPASMAATVTVPRCAAPMY